MYSKPLKTSVGALTILLLVASPVLAAGYKHDKPGGTSTMQTAPSRTSGMQEQSGVTTSATVVTVDKDGGTFTVLSEEGKPVEFRASEEMLSTMQAGDVVEVSVRKLQHGQQSGTKDTQHSQPGQSGSTSQPGYGSSR